jgi:hypothetical protein
MKTKSVVLKNAPRLVQLNEQLHGLQQTRQILFAQKSAWSIHRLMEKALAAQKIV